MKYTKEQKEKLKLKNKEKFRVKFCIESRVKNQGPINVEVIDGFYIIESQFNTVE
jgi:hypothetical protein